MIFTPTRVTAWFNDHVALKLHIKLQSCHRQKLSSPPSHLFGQTLTSRLQSLPPIPNPNSSIRLVWLAGLFDLVAAAISDASALIADPSLAGDNSDDLFAYLDAGVPFLDACNAISSEIARLRRRILPLRLALYHLGSGDGKIRPLSQEKLRRVLDAIGEWRALHGREVDAEVADSIEKLRNVSAPRGKISSIGSATYGLEVVSGLTATVAVATLGMGKDNGVEVFRVSSDWPWAAALEAVLVAVSGRFGSEIVSEVEAVEAAVERMTSAMTGGEVCDVFERSISDVEISLKFLIDGLDCLSDSVNFVFRAAIGIRNTALEYLRK